MAALTSFIGKSTELKNSSFLGRPGLSKVILTKDIQNVCWKELIFYKTLTAGVRCYQEVKRWECKRSPLHRCWGDIFKWHSHLVENNQWILEATFDELFSEVLVKYLFQNKTKYVSLMCFCERAIGGGKIPRLNGFYETGWQRIPTACSCQHVLRFKGACVGRDKAALKNISNTIIYPNHNLQLEFWTNATQKRMISFYLLFI